MLPIASSSQVPTVDSISGYLYVGGGQQDEVDQWNDIIDSVRIFN